MKLKLLILVFCFAFIGFGQAQNKNPNSLGIGFAIASNPYEFGNNHSNQIYKDAKLKTKIKTKGIYPFFYKPDYGLYHFICLEKTDSYYKILINDNEEAFIPNNKDFIFKTWESILIGASVGRKDKKHSIHEKHSISSKIIENNCELEAMQVEEIMEIKGEYWVFVIFDDDCDPYLDNSKNTKHGWIKWRTKDKLLVELFLLC